ncbi:hypothetical protein GJAV_G00100670 [Gymnothorax javanicus]|nr:hypothetical protein GJAV_G00100670 [Gymnothorax javanicus]
MNINDHPLPSCISKIRVPTDRRSLNFVRKHPVDLKRRWAGGGGKSAAACCHLVCFQLARTCEWVRRRSAHRNTRLQKEERVGASPAWL